MESFEAQLIMDLRELTFDDHHLGVECRHGTFLDFGRRTGLRRDLAHERNVAVDAFPQRFNAMDALLQVQRRCERNTLVRFLACGCSCELFGDAAR